MGASPWRILVVHMLPNTTSVLLPALTIGFNNAVLAEASMSFLGIGVTPPDASLGYMPFRGAEHAHHGPVVRVATRRDHCTAGVQRGPSG